MENPEIIIGRHVSVAAPEYLLGAAKEAFFNEYNAFMIYMGSPRNSLRSDPSLLRVEEFKHYLREKNLELKNIVVHGSYLINLGNTISSQKLNWSVSFLRRELAAMEEVGLQTLVVHPGSSLGVERKKALMNVADCLNDVLTTQSKVRIAIETMSGRKNELGSSFGELKFILDNIVLKELVGVCWDTCHMYSAGYDIKNALDEVIGKFADEIGLEKLWVVHINDSFHELNSRKDRHTNIGRGKLGLSCLQLIVHHKLLQGVIKLLETPRKDGSYKGEVKMLRQTPNLVS